MNNKKETWKGIKTKESKERHLKKKTTCDGV